MTIKLGGSFVDSGDNKSNAFCTTRFEEYCVNLVGVWQKSVDVLSNFSYGCHMETGPRL